MSEKRRVSSWRAVSGCAGPCTVASFASLCWGELGEREGGASWGSVRMRWRRGIVVKKGTPFAWGIYGALERKKRIKKVRRAVLERGKIELHDFRKVEKRKELCKR